MIGGCQENRSEKASLSTFVNSPFESSDLHQISQSIGIIPELEFRYGNHLLNVSVTYRTFIELYMVKICQHVHQVRSFTIKSP